MKIDLSDGPLGYLFLDEQTAKEEGRHMPLDPFIHRPAAESRLPPTSWVVRSCEIMVDPSNSPRQWDMWDPWERAQVLLMLARCLVFFRLPTPPNATHWKVFVEPLMDHWSQATHCCWTQQLTHKEPLPACQILLWPAELLASVSHNPCPYYISKLKNAAVQCCSIVLAHDEPFILTL